MEKIKIENILDKIGIEIDLIGYKYWTTAVELYMKKDRVKMSELYFRIAQKYNTTSVRVERALRHAHEKHEEKIIEYFNVDYKMTNKKVLELIAREVGRETWKN